MFLVPARKDLKVPDPALRDYLPPEGREVSGNEFYWARRIRDKDVTVRDAPPAVKRSST